MSEYCIIRISKIFLGFKKMSERITKFLGDIEFQVDGEKRLISNLITPSTTDSNFSIETGIDNFMIENKDISLRSETINGLACNILLINVPSNIKQKFLSLNQNIFKIVLRKNVIYDEQGRYIKEFYISTKDNKKKRPTGSNDPLGARRAAIGILRIILEYNLNIDLKELIQYSIDLISISLCLLLLASTAFIFA